MKDIIIKVFQYGNVYSQNGSLGITSENLQGRLIFDFEDYIVTGIGYLEFERDDEKGLIPLTYENEQYYLDIKSSLLKKEGTIKLQLRITEENIDGSIPVFKSEVFELEVKEAINATSEIPDEYPEWIDLANAKIQEIDNLNITAERTDDGVNIKVTGKDGTETVTTLKDGEPGPVGARGEPGAVKMEVVDTLPETAETDTIYLLKKENPTDENLYEEYVFTSTGWEHIGDTSVDLSDYYTKEETDIKYHYTGVGDISINENNEIGITTLTDEQVSLTNLQPGLYRLDGAKQILYNYGSDKYQVGSGANGSLLLVWKDRAISYRSAGLLFRDIKNEAVLFIDKFIQVELQMMNRDNILYKKNGNVYTPTGDYNPATKKYVDDSVGIKLDNIQYLTESVDLNDLKDGLYSTLNSSGISVKVYTSDSKSMYTTTLFPNALLVKYGEYQSFIIEKNIRGGSVPSIVILNERYNSTYYMSHKNSYYFTENYAGSFASTYALSTNNTKAYTPTSDYHPATKKYVDDKTGDLTTLNTTEQSNLVSAINEMQNATIKTLNDETIELDNLEVGIYKLTKPTNSDDMHIKYSPFNNDYDIYFGNKGHALLLVTESGTKLDSSNYYKIGYLYHQSLANNQPALIGLSTNPNGAYNIFELTENWPPYLSKYNTIEFEPPFDYSPATKKYVDDSISNIQVSDSTYMINTSTTDEEKVTIMQDVFDKYLGGNMPNLTYVNENGNVFTLFDVDKFETHIDFFMINGGEATTKYGIGYYAYDRYKINCAYSDDTITSVSIEELSDTYMMADNSQILGINNTTEYTPEHDYQPSTKKYVDDAIANVKDEKTFDVTTITGYDATKNMMLTSRNGVISWEEIQEKTEE